MIEKSDTITDRMANLLIDMICAVDVDGNYVYVSAASEKLLGYTPEEMLGRNMLEFMHPDDRERTLAHARKVMQGTQQNDFENRYIHKDGRIVDIMWSASWSEEDGVRLAVARDVTALKRATRRQEAMYRISEAARSSEDLPTLLHEAHRTIERLLPGERFIVALTESGTDRIWFPFFYDHGVRAQEPIKLHDGMRLSEVIRGGKGIIANCDHSSCEVTELPFGNRVRDWIGAPMELTSGVMGAVVMQRKAVAYGYSEDDLELLQFVATQLASLIERRSQHDQLLHQAHHDALTNLPNRSLFRDRVTMSLSRARRDKEMLALLYLDLRDFKNVNDEQGHAAGDKVLTETARRLVAALRESDTVARWGGDEFTALINKIHGRGDIEIVMAKLRRTIAEPMVIDGETLSLRVDIGGALYPDDGLDVDTLLQIADKDMYSSKPDRRQDNIARQG